MEDSNPLLENLAPLLRRESRILASRVTPQSLAALQAAGRLEIELAREEIVACGAIWPTASQDWFELGTLWVNPEHRGEHLCSRIFERLDAAHAGENLLLITRSNAVAHLAASHGWLEQPGAWTEQEPWRTVCEPWDRPAKAPGDEGRLFYREKR